MGSEAFANRLMQLTERVEVTTVARPRPPQTVDALYPAPLSLVYASTGLTWSQVPLTIAEAKGFFAADIE